MAVKASVRKKCGITGREYPDDLKAFSRSRTLYTDAWSRPAKYLYSQLRTLGVEPDRAKRIVCHVFELEDQAQGA